jgi:hypothetical protein
VMPCGVVHSEHDTVSCVADTTAHLHQQQTTYVSFYPEDGGSILLRNICNHLSDYMIS